MANKKGIVQFILLLVVVMMTGSGCSWHPRWKSWDPKKPNERRDHYDPYKRKWYKKRWNDGTLWR